MKAADSSYLHSGFLASVRSVPERPALSLDGDIWTYRELDDVVRVWASALTTLGEQPRRVGVLGHRSLVTYAGFLAALYAGATAVPLSTNNPAARNQDIMERAGVDVLLADQSSLTQLAPLLDATPDAPAVLLPHSDETPSGLPGQAQVFLRDAVADQEPLVTPAAGDPRDHAYLLYTSGSTGRPKGVPISHVNASAFLAAIAERYDFSAEDRFTNTFDQTFDASIFDLFVAWQSGSCLVPMDSFDLMTPVDFVRENSITVWFSVPSVGVLQHRRGALKPGCMPGLRWSLFVGEALPVGMAQAWQEAAPQSVVENLYGPSEATVVCLAHRWDPESSPAAALNGIVSIGLPNQGTAAVVLTEDGEQVPDGEIGELCVWGPQVFDGYLNAPELTERAFHTIEGPTGEAHRAYRTGDLVLRAEDGQFSYLGRLDSQVKILGHRIETGEVESHLMRQKRVFDAVVLAVPGDEEGTTVLAAILTGDGLDVYDVDEELRQTLPPYMIPLSYHLVESFPLNANGKVDRKELRAQIVSGELEPELL